MLLSPAWCSRCCCCYPSFGRPIGRRGPRTEQNLPGYDGSGKKTWQNTAAVGVRISVKIDQKRTSSRTESCSTNDGHFLLHPVLFKLPQCAAVLARPSTSLRQPIVVRCQYVSSLSIRDLSLRHTCRKLSPAYLCVLRVGTSSCVSSLMRELLHNERSPCMEGRLTL